MKPSSGRSSADILEGLTKPIREWNEDNATIRELEIGVLKGPLTSPWLGEGAPNADVFSTRLV